MLRRLRTLDDQHAFIRTRIFWVRDAQPVGLETLGQGQAELRLAAQAALRAAGDPLDASLWVPIGDEFVLALVGLVALPWPLHRARRLLRDRQPGRPRAASGPAVAEA